MKDIIELLKDSREAGHQITYTEVDGEAEPDCDSDCTGCRAAELHEVFKDFPTVVCLCGSTRFMDAFNHARQQETLAGKIVLSIEIVTSQTKENDPQHCSPKTKAMLDALHKRKIDLADEVLVLNVGGYIGESTRSELKYAIERHKTIRYWWTDPTAATKALDSKTPGP